MSELVKVTFNGGSKVAVDFGRALGVNGFKDAPSEH